MEKDDIDKINEQIDNILNEDKKSSNKKSKKEEVIDNDEGTTKKIDKIEDIEDDEEEFDKTKKIEIIDDLDEKNNLNKEKSIEETPEKVKDDKKKKIIIISIISVVTLLCIVFIIYMCLPSGKKSSSSVSKNKTLSKNEEKKVIEGYGDALKGIIAVYYDKQNVLLEYDDAVKLVNYDYKVKCSEHEIYEDGLVYLNKCTINDKKTKYSYGEKQEKKEEPAISEDAIKVYVSKKSGKATLNIPSNEEDYDIYYFEIDGEYSDLNLLSDTSSYVFYFDSNYFVHMINYKSNEKVFPNLNYSSVLPIKIGEEYDTNYVAVEINEKWGIYNLKNNERVVSHKYNSVTPLLYMGTSGPSLCVDALQDGIIAVLNYSNDRMHYEYGVIDYRNGKEIIATDYKNMYKSGKYLWAIDAYGEGHIFDYLGNEYLDNKFDSIYWLVDGKYVLVKDKKETKLVTIKGKELYNYKDVEIGSINYGLPYKDGALFQFDNPNKVDGNYDTDCVEIIYDATSKTGEVKTSYCGGIAKPVLYLYPNKTTKVNISFEHPEYLNTTYPKFVDKWEVTASSNGDLYDNRGNYYYALYWDEKKVHEVDFSTGYYVESDDAIEFLEKKLSYIGLSPKERNEFIMYWLPILERNEKNLVYFELTEERESYNKINIYPKPDSLLRLVIHVKKVDKKVDIQKQSLTKFQRKGFVAVEWGGTNY